MRVVILFYTKEPKPPEHYSLNNTKDLQAYNERIVELTKHKALFAIFPLGECVGDFS